MRKGMMSWKWKIVGEREREMGRDDEDGVLQLGVEVGG